MRRQDGSDMWTNLIGYVADPNDTRRGTFWLLEDRSAYKQAELALQQAYAEQKLIFDHSVVGISFVKNRTIQRCNHRFEELYGYAPGELIGQPTRLTYYSEQGYAAVGEAAYKALGRGETFVSEAIHQRQDGEPFWIRITGKAINPAAPNDGSIWNFEDITARKVAEDSLRQSEMLQRAILDSARLMILSTDPKGNIVSCNPATEQLLGQRYAELVGRPPTECFFLAEELLERRLLIASELEIQPKSDIETLLTKVRLGSVEQSEWTFRRANGDHFPVELSISSLHKSQGGENGFLFVANDITERKLAAAALLRSHDELENRVKERTIELEGEVNERRRAESRLRYLALHDPLTGLPNRNFLQQRIRETLEQAHNTEHRVAILFIDLNRFKTINDSLGHHIGDALLKKVAHRLTETLRTDDTVARIGGDEFVIIVPIADGEEKSANIAEKVLDILQPSFRIDGHELFVTPSIGICLYPHDGNSVEALMRNADTAMYQAKAAGRNTYRFFHPSMNAAVDNYFQIESSLRRAIDRDEFEVHYQPIINAKNGKPAAFEALVRWQHPTHGLLAPGRFITVAEESGLICQIGVIVVRAVCAQIRDWLDAGFQPPRVAINLSPIQFRDPNLISGIIAIVDEFGLTPDRIELEITETTLMQDGELTLSTLDSLSKYGFQLSVDDFGTGYSSLAYLKRFPVDTLKIDRSFIIDMTTDEDDQAIVTAILALAHSLRLSVVAEGVEFQAQFNALAALGCDYIQGYLISRPAPAADIERYLGTPPEITKTGTL
jgi:diguanylate cyclase (GGDEF)-like protein/PAS domain S-box-containing protein